VDLKECKNDDTPVASFRKLNIDWQDPTRDIRSFLLQVLKWDFLHCVFYKYILVFDNVAIDCVLWKVTYVNKAEK
jgi:hypothetical protein